MKYILLAFTFVSVMSGCTSIGLSSIGDIGVFDSDESEKRPAETTDVQSERIVLSEPERALEEPDSNFRFDEAFMDRPPVPRDEVDFSAVDLRVRNLPPEANENFDSLAASLFAISENQWELARAIFVWIADNIAYDSEAFFAGTIPPYQPVSVMQRGRAVCEGYSRLYLALARSTGLVVDQVSGYAKGYGHQTGEPVRNSNHAWNRVRIYGDWILIDPTWGAGHLSGRTFHREFNDFFFAPEPEALIFSHYPVNPEFQYLSEPLDAQTFSSIERVPPRYFVMGLDPKMVLQEIRNGREFRPPMIYGVGTFEEPAIQLMDVPWNRTLQADETYQFSISVDPEHPLTIINNDSRTEMTYNDGKASAVIRPSPGTVVIAIRETARDRRYQYLMEWQVR
jgi:hypothetical protein